MSENKIQVRTKNTEVILTGMGEYFVQIINMIFNGNSLQTKSSLVVDIDSNIPKKLESRQKRGVS
jgi:hypothetical protein